jgi:hypothetical protein
LKLYFVWTSSARAELRRIDREMAMRILIALTRFAETGEGDVKAQFSVHAIRSTSSSGEEEWAREVG